MKRKLRATKTLYETSIMHGRLYFESVEQCAVDSELFPQIIGDGYTKAIRIVSLSNHWVENSYFAGDVKLTTDINLQMTIRREMRSGAGYWYAYRRVAGKLHKRYVGTDEQVTEARLLDIAQKLPSPY
ncbi:MAG: hypothetical protein J0M33_23905 [Anaerolineae bacterium]|nr:hypothetical protein [Anaerolineae bacterium]